MQIGKETVTPKKATEWLKRNVNNRPMPHRESETYAKAMTRGDWLLNGESIKFNGNGDLIDGQTRLTACVKAGVPFETYVVRGLPHEAFDTLDQGKKRTIDDVLAVHNEKHYRCLAGAIRTAVRCERAWKSNYSALTPAEVLEWLGKNPGVRSAADWAVSNAKSVRPLCSTSIAAGFLHIFRKCDKVSADEFYTGVFLGEGLTKAMPAYTLRQKLIENASSQKKYHVDTIAFFIAKAWSYFRDQKPLKIMRMVEGEPFPVIK